MTGQTEKVALIINTASYERVVFALSLAAAALALAQKVNLLFTHGGLVRLKKGCTDNVAEETSDWLRDEIKAAVGKGAMTRISELIRDVKKLGGTIYACPAAMAYHNLTREELIIEVDKVRGVAQFLSEEAAGATKVVYV